MNWDRSETIALAKESCGVCKGEGQAPARRGRTKPCNCVLRAIFRACYARFRYCVTKEKFMSRVSLVPCHGKDQKMTYARLDEDYICDFSKICRRSLDNFDYNISVVSGYKSNRFNWLENSSDFSPLSCI